MTAPAADPRAVGRKQAADNAAFRRLRERVGALVPKSYTDGLLDAAAARIERACRGKRAAFAWSGGKDSQALLAACRRAGVEDCVLGMCNLEYPAFLAWVTEHMPEGLEVVCTGQDLDWLAAHPAMLFPQDAATAAKWFKLVQHAAQERYYRKHNLDLILLGRRRVDGNYTGPAGATEYTSKGVTRVSPIAGWTHADVLAVCHHENLPLPPCYDWPNGFVVGTGAWAARQYTGSVAQGWADVHAIDPAVVHAAADRIPSAAEFLASGPPYPPALG